MFPVVKLCDSFQAPHLHSLSGSIVPSKKDIVNSKQKSLCMSLTFFRYLLVYISPWCDPDTPDLQCGSKEKYFIVIFNASHFYYIKDMLVKITEIQNAKRWSRHIVALFLLLNMVMQCAFECTAHSWSEFHLTDIDTPSSDSFSEKIFICDTNRYGSHVKIFCN